MKKAISLIALSLSFNSSADVLQTVPEVDLKQYVGRWYEIASYPNYFQRRCASNVTADYAPENDTKISVVNSCTTANNEQISAKGWAKIVANSGNAKLRVTFLWSFFGDYWVIGLDPQYRYAVVGEPERENLWILSRTPQLEPELLNSALETARARGYDLSRLRYTKQEWPATQAKPEPIKPEAPAVEQAPAPEASTGR